MGNSKGIVKRLYTKIIRSEVIEYAGMAELADA